MLCCVYPVISAVLIFAFLYLEHTFSDSLWYVSPLIWNVHVIISVQLSFFSIIVLNLLLLSIMVVVNAVFFFSGIHGVLCFFLSSRILANLWLLPSLSWVLRKILKAFNSCRILNSPSLNSPALGQVLYPWVIRKAQI